MEYSLYWWLVARTNKEIARGDYFELGKVCIPGWGVSGEGRCVVQVVRW